MKRKLPLQATKKDITQIVKQVLTQNFQEKSSELMELFIIEYDKQIETYQAEDNTDLLRYYRLLTQIKPTLATLINSEEKLNEICLQIDTIFDSKLDEIPIQETETLPEKKPQVEMKYFCAACQSTFDIPLEKRKEMEASSERVTLPQHHGQEMSIRIVHNNPKTDLTSSPNAQSNSDPNSQSKSQSKSQAIPQAKSSSNTNPINEADKQKWASNMNNQDINSLRVLSVGIDVGSSTSHLVISRLHLKREFSFTNKTNQFKLVDREIVYEGNIIFTPLLDKNTIDIPKIVKFFQKEYAKANVTPEMIDTGAVIVTGETAKKENAAEIVKLLSKASGKFVSASAGPNFESMLGIMGSGILEESKKLNQTIMNVDIGGGTSNIAIASKGQVISTSCINVGGRLLGIDEHFKIWRIDEPTEWLMREIGLNYCIGDTINQEDLLKITKKYAKALLEVMLGPARSPIAKKLMMTADIEFLKTGDAVEKYSFSGGVAEFIYDYIAKRNNTKEAGNLNPYNDIGKYLAIEIAHLVKLQRLPLIEPRNKIRATVIGAGAFTLSVSGSTCYWDETVPLPLDNIPVVPIVVDFNYFFMEGQEDYLRQKVDSTLHNYGLIEGQDLFALYFKEQIYQSAIVPLALGIESALPNAIKLEKPILIILGEDGGKMLGLTLKRETSIKSKLLCLDELDLEIGDWIDIGAPLNAGPKKAFPITKKSLIFNTNKL